jgi:hypothetical protein
MAIYRTTRNIEASIIDFIKDTITESAYNWTNVNIEKSFSKIYTLSLPSICVKAERTDRDPAEIGNNKKIRSVQIIIDIFATDDGMRLDLKDCLAEILQDGCVFYEYTTHKVGRETVVNTKTANGRIRITNIDDNSVDFDVDRDKLDIHDRFRHRLTLTIELGRIE